jgi:PAS domain S-box-containing protein
VSDKKQAEEALRRSEERFALAVEGSTDVLWDAHRLLGEPWYVPQTPIWWSPRVRELLGLEESESFETLEQWAARLHSDDKDRVFGQLAAHIEQRIPYDVEYRLRTNRGNYLWVCGRGQASWDEQGEPRRMSGSCQDITERKRAEEVLRQNRAFLQSFVEHTPAAVAMLDRDLKYVAVSRRWYQDYRLVDRDIIGLHHYDVFPEIQKIEHWQAIHRRCLAGEIIKSDEDRFCREDGREDWLRWEVRPWVDESGSVGGIIMFTEVITERKRTEKALCESEERYRTLVDLSPNGVIVYSNGKKVYVNRAACTILGAASPDQLLENPTLHFSHPDDYESIHASLAQILATGKPIRRVERKYQRLDGITVFVEVDAGRIMWNGEPAVQVIFADITDRKQAESAFQESQQRFALAVQGSQTGIWDWDLRTSKTYFSPLWKSMLGYEEHIGNSTNIPERHNSTIRT